MKKKAMIRVSIILIAVTLLLPTPLYYAYAAPQEIYSGSFSGNGVLRGVNLVDGVVSNINFEKYNLNVDLTLYSNNTIWIVMETSPSLSLPITNIKLNVKHMVNTSQYLYIVAEFAWVRKPGSPGKEQLLIATASVDYEAVTFYIIITSQGNLNMVIFYTKIGPKYVLYAPLNAYHGPSLLIGLALDTEIFRVYGSQISGY